MLGVLVNTLAILVGGGLGLIFRKGIPQKLADAAMLAVGLCIVYIGISGALEGQNTLVLIVSMVVGTVLGELLDLDGAFRKLGLLVERKFQSRSDGRVSLAEGMVTASLLFCIGAMAVVGSLNAGLRGDNEMLFTKALLDCISACMLSVTLGAGVLLSSAVVFLLQGSIVLLSQLLAPILSASTIAELTCAGSLMILALGLNMMGITKIKVANFLPALVFVPLLNRLFSYLPI